MDIQEMLADLAAAVKRPGFWKNAAGQIAIAYGSSMISAAAEEAEERTRVAGEQLERLQRAITDGGESLRGLVVDVIREGYYDVEVKDRYSAIVAQEYQTMRGDLTNPAEGPPETAGAQQPDYDEPDLYDDQIPDGPPKTADGSIRDFLDIGAASDFRTGPPDGQPDVPPRMAGGYLHMHMEGKECPQPACTWSGQDDDALTTVSADDAADTD